MTWHIVLLLLSPLASLIGRLTPDDRDREILALRQQVPILQRQLGKRRRLRRAARLALVLTCLRMKKQRLLTSVLIVKPDTVVGWQRQIVRRHWTLKQKRKPGQPPIDPEAERLVVQIARGHRGAAFINWIRAASAGGYWLAFKVRRQRTCRLPAARPDSVRPVSVNSWGSCW